MSKLKQTYQECRTYQTCYIVGENALMSLRQAKHVLLAREVGLEVKFEQEEGYWFDYIGDLEPQKTWELRFEQGTHAVYHAYVQAAGGEYLARLGGIVVSNDSESREYLKAIELELLDEAVSYLLTKGVSR